jgi:hypothetical protein
MRPHLCLPAIAILLAGCLIPTPYASHPARTTHVQTAARPQPDSPLLVRLKNGHYRVKQPWAVKLNGKLWQVQKGYKSNGITAPAAIKKTLGDGTDHPETWAAVFHDWLFTQPGVSRAQADQLFYDLLIAYQVPRDKARLMHSTVAAYSLAKKLR